MPLVAGSTPGPGTWHVIICKNLALHIINCASLCISDETLNAVGPFYLVSMLGEVKYPTQEATVQPVVDSTHSMYVCISFI